MLSIIGGLFAARQRGVEAGAAVPTQKDQGSFESLGGYPPFRLSETRQRAEIRQALSYKTNRLFPTYAGAMGDCTGFVQSGPWLAKSKARVADRAARNNKSLQVQEGSRFRYQPSRME